MSINSRANRFRHHKTDARTTATRVGLTHTGATRVHDNIGLHRSDPLRHSGAELRRPSHPVLSREHDARPCQAVSLRRPLPRRPATMARPARVRMRRRKPCTRARRRLFGWKVRLPLATASSPRYVCRPPRVNPGAGRPALLSSAGNRRGPGLTRSLPCRRRTGDCSRVLTWLLQVKPGGWTSCSRGSRALPDAI